MSNTDAVESHDSLINKDDTRQYWNGVDADVNGMLGGVPSLHGFSSISKIDLQGSRNFLAKLGIGVKNGQRRVSSALEAGAGFVLSN
jgi:protein N-terminal methyltransferase